MKRVIWLCLFSLFVVPAAGQHRGGGGAGFGRGGFGPRGFGPGSLGHGRFRVGVVIGGFNHRFGFRSRFFPSSAFSPFGFPIYGGGYDYGYRSAPNIIVIQQPAPQVIVQQAPREVVQPEIHNYKESPPAAAAAPPTATGEEATFVIALNDGSRVSAAAVWVVDSMVHYVDTDDRHHQVPLKSIDRDSTRMLNRERELDLRLPAPQ